MNRIELLEFNKGCLYDCAIFDTFNSPSSMQKRGRAMFDDAIGLADEGHQSGDRRTDERITTVYRPVLIKSRSFESFGLVRNISPDGMMAKVYSDIAVGTSLAVQLHASMTVVGVVVWSENQMIGIRFGEAVDVSEVLTDLGRKVLGTRINRAPRLQIGCYGGIEANGRFSSVRIEDISQRGLKARASCHFLPNDEVTVLLDGLERRMAVVRWAQNHMIGLNFVRPLGMDELARWAIVQKANITDVGLENGSRRATAS